MTLSKAIAAMKNGRAIKRKGEDWFVALKNNNFHFLEKDGSTSLMTGPFTLEPYDVLADDWETKKVPK